MNTVGKLTVTMLSKEVQFGQGETSSSAMNSSVLEFIPGVFWAAGSLPDKFGVMYVVAKIICFVLGNFQI